jgi:class 3 adenylate cyclase
VPPPPEPEVSDPLPTEGAEGPKGLAAPELVRQALGRIADVAGADRVALVVVGGEAWSDPGGVPPLFPSGWLEALTSEPNLLSLENPSAEVLARIPWFEGARTAAVLSLELPVAGRAALVFSACQRPDDFSSEDLPLLSALGRQLGRVFSVAQTPARDRLDLEAWLAGERHLGSLVDRGSQEGLEVRSRDAVVLSVDARPMLGSLGELGPVSVLDRMNRLVEEVSRTVYAHGGLLERVQGDGVVAVWGALADGCDGWAAEEALRVAEVLWASSQFDGSLGGAVRVGLHAGRVSVGPVGISGRKSLALVGVASALAFRLGNLADRSPVASEEVLKRAGWVGPHGLDPRAKRVDAAGLGVLAFAVHRDGG